jgi:tRNA(Arg) A34 adenosine deaminase TadA
VHPGGVDIHAHIAGPAVNVAIAAVLIVVVRDPRLNHRVDVRGGVLEAECRALLKDFFANR